jgi:hypothetical protein
MPNYLNYLKNKSYRLLENYAMFLNYFLESQLYIYFCVVYLLTNFDMEFEICIVLGGLITLLIFAFYEYLFSQPIKIITLNINDDRRFEGTIPEIFPKLKKLSRAKKYRNFIANTIQEHGRSCIFNFCEILPSGMLQYLKSIFYVMGYEVSARKYCLDNKSFYYLLAWDPQEYNIRFVDQEYFTLSGNALSSEKRLSMAKDEILKECLGLEFERSMPVYYIKKNFGKKQIFLGQIHCGFPNENKKQICKKISDSAKNISNQIPFVVAGDWNCFDSDSNSYKYYDEMFSEIKNFSYISTPDLVKQGETHTFKSYEYDMFRHMTSSQKSQFKKKLQAYESADVSDKDIIQNEIKQFLNDIVLDLNKKQISKLPKMIRVQNLFAHYTPEHILESLIIDMIVGWNLETADTEILEKNNDLSDHFPLLTYIF